MVDHRVWFLAGRAAAEYGVGADEVLRMLSGGGRGAQRAKRRFAELACELWPVEAVARFWGRTPAQVRRLVR